jgi:hypothetical protein
MIRNYKTHRHHRQRGAALLICLVLLVFLGTLSGTEFKTVLADRREARTELIRQQVRMLQQDGLRRAELRRQIEPEFSGETIELKGKSGGVFRLKTVYNAEKKTFGVEAVFQSETGKTVYAQETEHNN